MDKYIVEGQSMLSGDVTISGSKNSSLPILAACLLTDEPCIIRRVPDVSDTNYMIQLLGKLGVDIERASGTVKMTAKNISNEASYDLVRKMRASICILGPLLARLKSAKVSLPGGCVIGDRPIDVHLRGFEGLGAKVNIDGGDINLSAKELIGNDINMRGTFGSTVLGTDNVMMAAVLAKGKTIIEDAAREPEVVDLANLLIKMGAKIEGAGTSRITIQGVEKLHGVEHRVIPDRIEAGTFLVAGAMASDSKGLTVKNVMPKHLDTVIDTIRACGHKVDVNSTTITVYRNEKSQGTDITTAPYPGFPTDMQAQFCALFATTPGLSVITEKIFPQRFLYAAELNRMGADITISNSSAKIHGKEWLSGAPIMANDLRASAALLLASLKAIGTTEIIRIYHIDRGYENIDEKLNSLGANILRVKE